MPAIPSFSRRRIVMAGTTAALASWSRLIGKESKFSNTKFWNTKEPSEWTADEIDRLITNSPWAKETKVSIPQPAGDYSGGERTSGGTGGGRPGGLSIPGMGGGRIGGLNIPGIGPGIGSGGGGGRGGQGRSAASKTDLIVRWESAKPVLDALRTPLAKILQNHYVVSLNGIPNILLRDQSAEPSARLAIKGKSAVRNAVVQQAPGAMTQSFLFGFSPQDLSFSPDDEVSFSTQLNRTPITATFSLKDMTYRGALEV